MLSQYFRIAFAFSLLLTFGCNRDTTTSSKPAGSSESESNPQATKFEASDVVKIVFVGQKQACECTRKRIDTTWKVLQKTLGGRADISVARIQLDVDEEQADKLDDRRSLMVAPGIYFFDANENLLEMLQGEVTSEQISKVL